MKSLKQSLREIERRWLRPLVRGLKRHRRPAPSTAAFSPGAEQLLVSLLRAEVRRREAGGNRILPLDPRDGASTGGSELESLAASMLTLPSGDRRVAG